MKFCKFPESTTEIEITDMLYEGVGKGECPECGTIFKFNIEEDIIKCIKCNITLGNPFYNEEEFNKERPIF